MYEFRPEPRQISGIAVCTHLYRWFLRHGLCSQQADRPRKRSGDGQQRRGTRDAVSPWHRRRTYRPGWFYLRSVGSLRFAQGSQPAKRGADFLSIFDKPQRDALAMLFLNLHGRGFVVCEIFWGLWLFPLALLVYRSRFLPRFLCVWLALAGFAWVILSLTSTLLPQYQDRVNSYLQPAIIGEIVFMLWLLIRGAKPQAPDAAASLSAVA